MGAVEYFKDHGFFPVTFQKRKFSSFAHNSSRYEKFDSSCGDFKHPTFDELPVKSIILTNLGYFSKVVGTTPQR